MKDIDKKETLLVFDTDCNLHLFSITKTDNPRGITREMIKEAIEFYYSNLYEKVSVEIETDGLGIEYATVNHDGHKKVLSWTYLKNFIF